MAIAHLLYVEKVPVFEVQEATVRETLGRLRNEWTKKHPREPFPVGELKLDEPREGAPVTRVTLNLKGAPYIEILKYIANLANLELCQKNGVMTLEAIGMIREDWTTRSYAISPAALTALGLNAKSTEKEVRAALKRYEIELADWMRMQLTESGTVLVITTMDEQHEQIAGLLHLLGKGFKITK